MNKSISLLLAILIMFASVLYPKVNVNAETKHSLEIIYQSEMGDEPYIEIIKSYDTYYFYKQEGGYSEAFSIDKNNNIFDAYSSKTDEYNSIIKYSIPVNTNMNAYSKTETSAIPNLTQEFSEINTQSSLENKSLDLFDNIFNVIESYDKEVIDLGKGIPSDAVTSKDSVTQYATSSSTGSSSEAIKKAQDKYGYPVTRQYVGMGTYFNNTGYLFYTKSFGAYPTMTKIALLGATITALSIALGLPINSIPSVVGLVLNAANILVSKLNYSVHFWETTKYDLKNVTVNNEHAYSSKRDIIGNVAFSITGVTDFIYVKTKSNDTIYNNDQSVIKRGCELYVMFQ